MSSRKQTPDVLGAILGGSGATEPSYSSSAAPGPADPPAAVPEVAPKPVRTPRPRKPSADEVVEHAPAAPTAVDPVPTPIEWEYLEVVFREFRGWRPRLVNGREASGWKHAPPIIDYLQQLGDEGWELVAMGNPVHNEKTAYFKRQKR